MKLKKTLGSWKKSYDKSRECIKKKWHHFANKGLVKVFCFFFSSSHVWYESCTIKKATHSRTDAFKLLCWRRLSRVPWTARSSNQSILLKLNPEYSLEELMPKLKLQYFGHLMWRTYSLKRPWFWKRLRARGEKGNRGWDLLVGITDSMDMSLSKLQIVKDREALSGAV